jgi:hypothetical protein
VVEWEGPTGPSVAGADPWSDLAGTFSFHRPAVPDVALKLVDGRSVNGHVWLFTTSLTSLAYTVTVTDTETGETRIVESPAGSFTGLADLAAF